MNASIPLRPDRPTFFPQKWEAVILAGRKSRSRPNGRPNSGKIVLKAHSHVHGFGPIETIPRGPRNGNGAQGPKPLRESLGKLAEHKVGKLRVNGKNKQLSDA